MSEKSFGGKKWEGGGRPTTTAASPVGIENRFESFCARAWGARTHALGGGGTAPRSRLDGRGRRGAAAAAARALWRSNISRKNLKYLCRRCATAAAAWPAAGPAPQRQRGFIHVRLISTVSLDHPARAPCCACAHNARGLLWMAASPG